ncbi:MAG: hypothetical protein E2O52_06600, partial [Gammaproteobacteria bacterium]
MQQSFNFRVIRAATFLVFASVLSGCGGGGGGSGEGATLSLAIGDDFVTTTIAGSVGDGPITGGNVVILNRRGEVLATQRSNEQARYQIELDISNAEYPLTVRVDDGTDIVTGDSPAFTLLSAVMQPGGEHTANLNPFGTLAVKIAQKMPGGLSAQNIDTAIDTVYQNFGFGIDTQIISNPINSVMSNPHVAGVVRSSEALGEAIRRAHAALLSGGQFVNPDQLIEALSADLIDGVLDGHGADGADARLAATIRIVSAQVMLETMANRLVVGGIVVTDALDSSIRQITGGDLAAPLTHTLNVTDLMLIQAHVFLEAAMSIDSSPGLESLQDALALVVAGQSGAQVAAILPADAVVELGATIEQVTLATPAELARVNAVVGELAPPPDEPLPVDPPANRIPVISGLPATLVTAGSAYEFTLMASDADGDVLSFMISGTPTWASFDTSTGRLSGTPGNADIGISAVIQISVSDGFASVELPGFQITVVVQPNRLPAISGAPSPAVTVGNLYDFTPTAADPDGDPLSFSVLNLPDWATFEPNSGRLSGAPGAIDVGVFNGIQITVFDGKAQASLPPFVITVSGVPNQAPTISGSPATRVTVNAAYTFTPTASDPDGDVLSFTISGQPAWTSFSASTGHLSGTPRAGDEGTYS